MSKFQRFVVESVRRSSIKLADYNPRTITDHARGELKRKIKTVGLLEPLIWNRRTGVLVSGHQRLSQLDELEGYPAKDYDVMCSVVDLDPKTEREMNVFLNNPSAQGEFDVEALKMMVMEMPDLDLVDMGFQDADINILFEDIDALGNIKDMMEKSEATGQLEQIKADRKKASASLKAGVDADFYFVVVCKDAKHKQKMLSALGAERKDSQYVRAELISRLLDLGENE